MIIVIKSLISVDYLINKIPFFFRRQKYAFELNSLSEERSNEIKYRDVPRQRLYGCSFDYSEENELDSIWQNKFGLDMSSSSSAGTGPPSLSSGYTVNSGRQTPEQPLSESRTTSVSSIRSELSELTTSPAASPQIRLHNPFLEKLLVDSATLQGMNLMTADQDRHWKRQVEMNKNYNKKSSKLRDLVLPEEEQEQYPFAKHTFNKKPEIISSSSEISSGSRDSSLSPLDSLNFTRNNDYLRHGSTASSQLSEDFSSTETGTGTSSCSFNTSFSSRQSTASNYPPSPDVCHTSPAFPQSFQPYNMPNPRMFSQYSFNEPDQILYNLGFGNRPETFLPERFAQDWYKKIQQTKINQAQQQTERPFLEPHIYESMGVSSPKQAIPQFKSQHDSQSTAAKAKREHRKMQQFSVQEKENSNTKISGEQLSVSKLFDLLKRENQHFFKEYNSFSTKDLRRKQFASHLQKSLPTYLETLNEEDEGRTKCGLKKSSKMERVLETESSSSEEKSYNVSMEINSDVSDSGSSNLELQENNMNDQLQKKHIVPSILICQSPVRDTFESKDSLEVANILSTSEEDKNMRQNSYRTEVHLEPAMLSMVLQDAESTRSNQLLTVMRPNGNGEYSDDRLHPTSPSSASSISPCPLSPVTVIEVNLDNQNDSIDTEEGVNSNHSRDNSLDKESSSGDNQTTLSLTAGKQQKGKLAGAVSSSLANYSNSPVTNELNSVKSVLPSSHESSMQPSSKMCEAFVQTEDKSLSPLLSVKDLDGLLKQITNGENEYFYVAEDKEIQCDLIKDRQYTDALTESNEDTLELSSVAQTDRILDDSGSITGSFFEMPNINSIPDTSCVSVEVQTDQDYGCSCGKNINKGGKNNSNCKSFLGLSEGSYNVKNEANFSRIFSASFCDSISDDEMNKRGQGSFLSPESCNYSPLEVTLDRLESKAQHWKAMISHNL